ncbi:MAG: copper chaperone PCu(A)C [Jatrophihabitans sp.]
MTRPPLSLLAAAVVVIAGFAGLVRGALPQSVPAAAGQASPAGQGTPIVVSGAYIREPANGINAAAYLVIYNTTGSADQLVSASSGAGALTTVHATSPGMAMMSMGSLSIPAHGSYDLSPTNGHLMIEKLYGPLKAGQSVNLELDFAKAGEVLVTAPVIGVTAPAPTTAIPK